MGGEKRGMTECGQHFQCLIVKRNKRGSSWSGMGGEMDGTERWETVARDDRERMGCVE